MDKDQKDVIKEFTRNFENNLFELENNLDILNLDPDKRDNANRAFAILKSKLQIMRDNKPGDEKAMKKAIKLNKLFESKDVL